MILQRFSAKYFGGKLDWEITEFGGIEANSTHYWAFVRVVNGEDRLLPVGKLNTLVDAACCD